MLGRVRVNPPVQVLSDLGLGMLLFLAGLEIDAERLLSPGITPEAPSPEAPADTTLGLTHPISFRHIRHIRISMTWQEQAASCGEQAAAV